MATTAAGTSGLVTWLHWANRISMLTNTYVAEVEMASEEFYQMMDADPEVREGARQIVERLTQSVERSFERGWVREGLEEVIKKVPQGADFLAIKKTSQPEHVVQALNTLAGGGGNGSTNGQHHVPIDPELLAQATLHTFSQPSNVHLSVHPQLSHDDESDPQYSRKKPTWGKRATEKLKGLYAQYGSDWERIIGILISQGYTK